MRPKVAVYAIAKNEEAHVGRWMDAVSEADGIFVADTGSSDRTVEMLRERGASVTSISIDPWRFDAARNAAMALVPGDYEILYVVDMDEVPEDGWARKIKDAWTGDVNLLEYTEVFSHRPDGAPAMTLPKRNIHNRDFVWRGPVHETLVPAPGKEVRLGRCQMTVHHWQDEGKPRGQYLPLLELAVAEAPADDRMAYYYGRELFYEGKWEQALAVLTRHAGMSTAWVPERAAGLCMIGECHAHLGHAIDAEAAFLRACGEHPHGREPWLACARFYLGSNNFAGAYWAGRRALAVKTRLWSYIEEEASWREAPHDIISVAAWYLGHKSEARHHVNLAIMYAPWDRRIQNNHTMIEEIVAPESH